MIESDDFKTKEAMTKTKQKVENCQNIAKFG